MQSFLNALQNWQKVFSKYLSDRQKVFSKYFSDRQKIFSKYFSDRQKVFSKYLLNRRQILSGYLSNWKQSLLRLCRRVKPTKPANAGDIESQRGPKEWKDPKLNPLTLLSFMMVQLFMIAATTTLLLYSRSHFGIVDVEGTPDATDNTFGSVFRAEASFWNMIPPLILTIYKISWEAIITACADRQPFVELHQDTANLRGRGTPRLTLLLHYGSFSKFKVWIVAFRNGHIVLGFSMLLSLVASFLLIPSMAYLFTDVNFSTNSTRLVLLTTYFDASMFDSDSDIRPAIQQAIATHVFAGNAPPWTDLDYAFPQFSQKSGSAIGNLTTIVNGSSAQLDCRLVPKADVTTTGSKSGRRFTITDRGCTLSRSVGPPDPPFTIVDTWSYRKCGPEHGFSRFNLLVATNSTHQPGGLGNFSIVSCIPSYWMTPGDLTVTFGLTRLQTVAQFVPNRSRKFPAIFPARDFYETNLQFLTAGLNPLTHVWANEIGLAIYNYAKHLNPSSPLEPAVVVNATSSIYSSVFAVWATAELFRKAESPEKATAIQTIEKTRLVIVEPVAWLLVGALTTMLILILFILFCTARRKSILLEEPGTLLSYAGIVHGSSSMQDLVGSAKREYFGKVAEGVRKNYVTSGKGCKSRCLRNGDEADSVIVISQPMRKRGTDKRSRLRRLWDRFCGV